MKMTFPHLGQVYIPVSLALRELGISCVVPPGNHFDALEAGKSVSPEEMCLPFKFMAGNLIQACEQGAECVIMPATMGPCRLGEYGELLKQVLDSAGYHMEWILMDSPKAIGWNQWLKRLKYIVGETERSSAYALGVLLRSIRLMRNIDCMEAHVKGLAGYAENPAHCVRLLEGFRKELNNAETLEDAFASVQRTGEMQRDISVKKEGNPVKIFVTGEIYTSIEDAANGKLEEQLMLLGCSVRRPVTVSWWVSHTVKEALKRERTRKQTYLPYSIGGYARETIQEIYSSREDGIIKIMPAGCMPEIVAKAVSNRIEEDTEKRVLHLVYDEMQAAAGYETRIEAFVDMLERRKRVFFGN